MSAAPGLSTTGSAAVPAPRAHPRDHGLLVLGGRRDARRQLEPVPRARPDAGRGDRRDQPDPVAGHVRAAARSARRHTVRADAAQPEPEPDCPRGRAPPEDVRPDPGPLRWKEFSLFYRTGYARRLLDARVPPRDEARPVLPAWAVDQAGTEAAATIELLRASKVTVLGDLENLRRVPEAGDADPSSRCPWISQQRRSPGSSRPPGAPSGGPRSGPGGPPRLRPSRPARWSRSRPASSRRCSGPGSGPGSGSGLDAERTQRRVVELQ